MRNTYGILVTAIIAFVFLTGFIFSSKDEDYYRKNPDKANSDFAKCESRVNKAFRAGDLKKAQELSSDEECKAADKIVREIKKNKRIAEREQQQKIEIEEKAIKDKKLKNLMEEYSSLPLSDRVFRNTEKTDQWYQSCINLKIDRYGSACNLDNIGGEIYKRSYKDLSSNKELKEKTLSICKGYEKEYYKKNKRKTFNARPNSNLHILGFGEKVRGINECHAAYDLDDEDKLKYYASMPFEKRVMEFIECDNSKNNSTCKSIFKKSKKMIAKAYKSKFQTDKNAKAAQYEKCKNLQKKLNEKGRHYMFSVRNMGECSAANYR